MEQRESLPDMNKKVFGVVLAGLLGLFMVLLAIHGLSESTEDVRRLAVQRPALVDFVTLSQRVTEGGAWIDLCVDKTVTRVQARSLVVYLRDKYYSGKSVIIINVFNDPSALEHRDDPKYPAKKYAQEWLAQLWINKTTGYSRIDTSGGL